MKLKQGTIVKEMGPEHENASGWELLALVQETRHRLTYLARNIRDDLADHRALLTICRYEKRLLSNRSYVDNLRKRLVHQAKMLSTPLNLLPEPIDFFHTQNSDDPFSFPEASHYRQSEPVLVTKPYAGEPLDHLVQKRGALSQYRTLSLGLQLCDLLEDLHRQRLLLYEFRPEDILLDTSDHDRLWLMGLANLQQMDARHQVPIKNLVVPLTDFSYTAPEVEAGSESLDTRSDFYSLGALLLFLLTGKNPRDFLRGSKNSEAIYGLRELHPETCWLLDRCLSFDPAARFLSTGEIREALRSTQEKLRTPVPIAVEELLVTRNGGQHHLQWQWPTEGMSPPPAGLLIQRWISHERKRRPPSLEQWETILDEKKPGRSLLSLDVPSPKAAYHYAVTVLAHLEQKWHRSHPTFTFLDRPPTPRLLKPFISLYNKLRRSA
jgi:serine/threonine protein kinase